MCPHPHKQPTCSSSRRSGFVKILHFISCRLLSLPQAHPIEFHWGLAWTFLFSVHMSVVSSLQNPYTQTILPSHWRDIRVDHYGFANRDHTLIAGLTEDDVVELKEVLLRFEKSRFSGIPWQPRRGTC